MTSTMTSYVAAGTPAEVVSCGVDEALCGAHKVFLEEIPMNKLDAESEYWDFDQFLNTAAEMTMQTLFLLMLLNSIN